ncbi:bifunctional 2',3'-cyclic-nucleotide 2'-phosphodiesterase/3'-nucleotidase [Colwellia echini]|uniref:Bifunctional 2',3'-cyclic-nucleotide 2'-phosphodiesterase/3'-nucleotidase n=1 Tax=Colwellia echini TaxID=1982103 RepID=A0ABY3MZJ9_9GAMM|nr:bifunctional 2',3'-cyclic-nucleotide 2'-phosphodiesterase/3'-nucleotidase [Colwellia echini]TYK66660.1 bifunctional 2',3'-cyclic-nucleotide 2'-phosphodiesterase/3'-nucleotidase [Colwellia echini]
MNRKYPHHKKLITALCLCISVFFTHASQATDTVKLRILETTDIHMYLADYDYYRDQQSDSVGLSRVVSLIHNARSEVNNSLLIDNGDLLQGSPLGEYIAQQTSLSAQNIHPAYKIMNPLSYNVGNLGNHEFNFGIPFLKQAISGANFPYISANVYIDDADNDPTNDVHFIKPYLIEPLTLIDDSGKKHSINVGYIGFTPPQIMLWDMGHLKGKVIAKDIVETAEKLVPEMKKLGADIIIAIPHSGLYNLPRKGMDENATYHLAKVQGIDAILFGHSHRVFPGDKTIASYEGVNTEKGTVFGIPAVMPGFWGSHLGLIDLTLQKSNNQWSVIDSQASVRAVAKRDKGKLTSLVKTDEASNKVIMKEHKATLEYMRQKVGETTSRIHSYFALVLDDPSVQLVNNAQKQYVERIIRGTELADLPVLSAAAPFKSGGRIGPDYYTDIPAGKISLIHLQDLYVFPNDLKVVQLNGLQVIEWLEFSAGQFNQIDPTSNAKQAIINPAFASFNFDIIDGIQYQIDVTQPARYDLEGKLINPKAARITKATYQGKPLSKAQTYLVATNNYRAGGGGNFPNLDGSNIVIHAPDKNRSVVAAYIQSVDQINPAADGNWHFADTFGKAKVIFTSSTKAKDIAPKNIIALPENAQKQVTTTFEIRH